MENVQRQDGGTQELFKRLKGVCVPLLGDSHIDHQSLPKISSHLSDLVIIVKDLDQRGIDLQPSLLSYVFFPLSTLLGRNSPAAIPDQVLEKVFVILTMLFERWWWTCDLAIWEQIFMLAGAVLGGIHGKGKGKDRGDETKEAAANLLWSLLRARDSDSGLGSDGEFSVGNAQERFAAIKAHTQTAKFMPIIGRTFASLLPTAASPHMPLQLRSLQLIDIVSAVYFPDSIIPSIIPGVVSSMANLVLGRSKAGGGGLAKGAVVTPALHILEVVIVRAVGDDICVSAGLVKQINNLEDLSELESESHTTSGLSAPEGTPYTLRTQSWFRATSSQLLIALNTLTPLVLHPTASALLALSSLSSTLLSNTHLTLPGIRPLLLSFLLSLSNSRYDSVIAHSRTALLSLLMPPSNARHGILQSLMQMTADSLSTLPRLLTSRSDAKVEHIAGQVEAVCRLGAEKEKNTALGGIASIRSGVTNLLGPSGHIEKWGWSLLSVLNFAPPRISSAGSTTAYFMLENAFEYADQIAFPPVFLKHVQAHSTHEALDRMLCALGRTGGDDCLYSVEWFIGVGRNARGANATAALWCAGRILEGIAGISLEDNRGPDFRAKGKRLDKFCRWLTKIVAESWSVVEEKQEGVEEPTSSPDDDGHLPIEYVKGLDPLKTRYDLKLEQSQKTSVVAEEPVAHKAFLLQLLSICAAVLEARFIPLLLHALYPILHSLVSPQPHLSSTALSALRYITNCTGYATPANLLVSNFDYALDAVSRRLTRRWLDVDATKVLVILVRLVGRDVVHRAGDVVEECFDRLDDFHGYEVIVEGLIEALNEVVKVVQQEEGPSKDPRYEESHKEPDQPSDKSRLDRLLDWYVNRSAGPVEPEHEDFGPAPREAWGTYKGKETGVAEGNDGQNSPDGDPLGEPPATPAQALTKQIVSRSHYFLTHGSALIRASILELLCSAVPVLPESALLPSVHKAWPFVLNRLSDQESFVVTAAAALVEALATHVGGFMTTRIWDDVWPRFSAMLRKLDASDAASALARRGVGGVGTESAHTHSHRLHRSMLKTMTASVHRVPIRDPQAWDVMTAFRRFLHNGAHEDLQECARTLYIALAENNEDAVWLVLSSTTATPAGEYILPHLKEDKWDIKENVEKIFATDAARK